MPGMMDGMGWMMWGGLLLWLVVVALLVWMAVELVKYLRSNRAK
jgi:hypothetical protein